MARKTKKKVAPTPKPEKKELKMVELPDVFSLMLPLGLFKLPTKEGAAVTLTVKGVVTLSKRGTSGAPEGYRLICVIVKEAVLL